MLIPFLSTSSLNCYLFFQVNPGSLADQAGLRTGDIIVKIQGQNAELLLHKEAQDVILRAGNYLDITVMRHGSCLDVKVPPPVLPRPHPPHAAAIASHGVSSSSGIPLQSRPLSTSFESVTPTSSATLPLAPPLTVQKYNSPINLYSMKNIKEAIDAHSQVLAPGVIGINFMKPDASINTHSPVYQAVLEEEAKAKIKPPSSPFMDSNLLAEQQYHEVLRDASLSPSVHSSSFRRLQDTFGGNESMNQGRTISGVPPSSGMTVSGGPPAPTTREIPVSMQPLPPPSINTNNNQTLSWMEMMNDKRSQVTTVTSTPANCPTCGQPIPKK